MVKNLYVPERGDIVWVNFSPQQGHEQKGRRPALVISPRLYNSRSRIVLLCPITSKQKGYPFEVTVKIGKIFGFVLADQLKSIDFKARDIQYIDKAPNEAFARVQREILKLIQ